MAQAAAMLTGLVALWFMLAPRVDSAGAVAVGVAAAAAALGASRWLLGRALLSAPRGGSLRIGKLKRGGELVQAAFSPERLSPGFVKIKARNAAACAALARAATANGAVVVEVETDGLLVHAIDENAIEALGRAVVERDAP